MSLTMPDVRRSFPTVNMPSPATTITRGSGSVRVAPPRLFAEVRRVVGHEAIHRGLRRRLDRLRIAGTVRGDETRQPLGVERVIRRGGPHQAELPGVLRGRELDHVGAVVEGHDHAPIPAHEAAEGGRDGDGNATTISRRWG